MTNSTKNIDPKEDRKQDASWDGFWMALGSIFGGSWAQVGWQDGAKMNQESTKMGRKQLNFRSMFYRFLSIWVPLWTSS